MNDETFGKITRVVRLLTGCFPSSALGYSIRKAQEFDDRECVICEVYERGSAHEVIFPVEYLEWTNDRIVRDMLESLALHDEVLQDTRCHELRKQEGRLQVPVTVDIDQLDQLVAMGLATYEDWFDAFDSLWPDKLSYTRKHFEKRFDSNKH